VWFYSRPFGVTYVRSIRNRWKAVSCRSGRDGHLHLHQQEAGNGNVEQARKRSVAADARLEFRDPYRSEHQCGWLWDRFGLSWQVIPTTLGKLLGAPDREKAGRAMQAMLQMKKLDIAGLQAAFDGRVLTSA